MIEITEEYFSQHFDEIMEDVVQNKTKYLIDHEVVLLPIEEYNTLKENISEFE